MLHICLLVLFCVVLVAGSEKYTGSQEAVRVIKMKSVNDCGRISRQTKKNKTTFVYFFLHLPEAKQTKKFPKERSKIFIYYNYKKNFIHL